MKGNQLRTALLASIAVVGAAGIGFAIAYHPVRPIEFRPTALAPKTVPVEGDIVKHALSLHNPNSFPVRLGEPRVSCGCGAIKFPSGQPLNEGQVLAAKESLDLAVDLRTGGQAMPREVQIEVPAATFDGRPVPFAYATIKSPVKAGPRIAPMALVLRDVVHDREATGEFVVTDGQDEPVTIKQVTFSDPKHLSARVVPADPIKRRRESPVKLSNTVVVTYRSSQPPEMSSEFVEVTFDQSRFAPLRVPIYIRSSQTRAGFVPEKLVLVPQPGTLTVKRTVMLKTGGDAGEVKVVTHPPFVGVEVGDARDDGQEIKLSIDMEALVASTIEQNIVVSVGDGKEHTLPIKALAIK